MNSSTQSSPPEEIQQITLVNGFPAFLLMTCKFFEPTIGVLNVLGSFYVLSVGWWLVWKIIETITSDLTEYAIKPFIKYYYDLPECTACSGLLKNKKVWELLEPFEDAFLDNHFKEFEACLLRNKHQDGWMQCGNTTFADSYQYYTEYTTIRRTCTQIFTICMMLILTAKFIRFTKKFIKTGKVF